MSLRTHVATAQSIKAFGPLARVEAERRGLREALAVIALGDGATVGYWENRPSDVN